MNRNRLKNYIALKSEIAELRQELRLLEKTDNEKATAATRKRLKHMIEKLERERDAIEQWIEEIPDSVTRQVFRERYINGQSWAQMSARMKPHRSPDALRKIHQRFFKK